jgi:hypothetical protein
VRVPCPLKAARVAAFSYFGKYVIFIKFKTLNWLNLIWASFIVERLIDKAKPGLK